MKEMIRKIQERILISENSEFDIDQIADLIDSEIALERKGADGVTIKADSVIIVYGDEDRHLKFPCVYSGEEFRKLVRRYEKFLRIR